MSGYLTDLLEKRTNDDWAGKNAAFLRGDELPGNETWSGVNITERNSLRITTVFKCIRLLSETVSTLPLHLFKKLKPKGSEKAFKHSLYKKFHLSPNPEMTSVEFRKFLQGYLVGWGNAYAYKEKDTIGRIIALWPLRSDRMEVKRKNNILTYIYKLPNGERRYWGKDKVFHLKDFSLDGVTGLSRIAQARESLGLSKALEQYGATFFGHGAHAGGMLEHPGTLGDEAYKNLKKSINEQIGGLTRAHALLILEEGMKFSQSSIPPEHAQFLESMKFRAEDIAARIFDIPPHMAGLLDRATFSNIEHQALEFVKYTLNPWLILWEQRLDLDFLNESEQEEFYFKHNVDGLLRGDHEARGNFYTKLFGVGALDIDEIREKENMNPVKGGNKRFIPLNFIELNMAGELPTGKEKEKKSLIESRADAQMILHRNRIVKQYHPLFVRAAEKIISRESGAIKRYAEKYLGNKRLADWDKWFVDFYEDLPEYIRSEISPVIKSYIEITRNMSVDEVGVNSPDLEEFTRKYIDIFAYRHIESSKGQIKNIIGKAETDAKAGVVIQRADEWIEKWPGKVAKRETNQLLNAVVSVVVFNAGLRLVWKTQGVKTCPWCQSLNGKIISSGQTFVKAGEFSVESKEKPMLVRRSKRHPPLHGGCDCMVLPG